MMPPLDGGWLHDRFGNVAKLIHHLLIWAKQACEHKHITIHSMCKILTRTQSLSCGLQNLSYCCREENKVVNKMCSRGRMKAGGQEIQGKRGGEGRLDNEARGEQGKVWGYLNLHPSFLGWIPFGQVVASHMHSHMHTLSHAHTHTRATHTHNGKQECSMNNYCVLDVVVMLLQMQWVQQTHACMLMLS